MAEVKEDDNHRVEKKQRLSNAYSDNASVQNETEEECSSGSSSKKACCYCKKRRKRCEACISAGTECTFLDRISGRELPKDYISKLEKRVAELESQSGSLENIFIGPYLDNNDTQEYTENLAELQYDNALYLLAVYEGNIQRYYPFLDWRWVLECLENVCKAQTVDNEATAFIYLILSIGMDLTNVSDSGPKTSDTYYVKAMKHLASTISSGNVKSIQIYLLLAIKKLVNPSRGLSQSCHQVWYLSGLAIRTAVSLGLHRKPRSRRGTEQTLILHVLQNLRSRIFWSAYSIERLIGMILGRPFSISDVDIDAPLPEIEDGSNNCNERSFPIGTLKPCPSSSASEMLKLRRIQSSICLFVYGPRKFLDNDDEINQSRQQILLELDEWKTECLANTPNKGCSSSSELLVDINYNQSVVWLLRPVLFQIRDGKRTWSSEIDASFLPSEEILEWYQLLMNSATQLARAAENLTSDVQLLLSHGLDPLSMMHTLFVAGVTYVYCSWLDGELSLLQNDEHSSEHFLSTAGLYEKLLTQLADKWAFSHDQDEILAHFTKLLESIQQKGKKGSPLPTVKHNQIHINTLIQDPESDVEDSYPIAGVVKSLMEISHRSPNLKQSYVHPSFSTDDTLLEEMIWDLEDHLQ